MTLVSVVVAVRGNAWGLRPLMRGHTRQEFVGRLEVVVVDNHDQPTLSSSSFVVWPVQVQLVHEPRPGLSYARNTGIRHALHPIVLVADPGMEPDPDWVRTMVSTLEYGGAQLVSGRVELSTESGDQLPSALAEVFVSASWPQVVNEAATPWDVAGCPLGMPAPDRREPPQFDARRTGPDLAHRRCGAVELAARLRAAGDLVHVTPQAVVRRELPPEDLTVMNVWARAWWRGALARRWRHVPAPEKLALPLGWWRTRLGRLALVAVTAQRCAHWTARLRPGSRGRAVTPTVRRPAAVPGRSEERP
ncbi:glycosyltransferase [Streptomyces sp. NPDC049555]|uniref:glycosyltransferase family 2 protein n=1 Tax=Streptomyces sp. NPDC049555 TaxID=3154930 RepID=UPI0034132139